MKVNNDEIKIIKYSTFNIKGIKPKNCFSKDIQTTGVEKLLCEVCIEKEMCSPQS